MGVKGLKDLVTYCLGRVCDQIPGDVVYLCQHVVDVAELT